MGKKKGKSRRTQKMIKQKKNSDVLTEEECDTYMAGLYNLEYIAGYTSGGVPYGASIIEEEWMGKESKIESGEEDIFDGGCDDIPF